MSPQTEETVGVVVKIQQLLQTVGREQWRQQDTNQPTSESDHWLTPVSSNRFSRNERIIGHLILSEQIRQIYQFLETP